MAKTQKKTKSVPAKTHIAAFKVTPEQHAMIVARAEERGLPAGPWMRAIVLQAATAPKNGRFLRINEPSGATT